MSDSLKANFLFIGHHWFLDDFCHQRNLDMKGDYYLSDFKNKEMYKVFLTKNSSQIEFEFFDRKLPYETRTSLCNRLLSIRNT